MHARYGARKQNCSSHEVSQALLLRTCSSTRTRERHRLEASWRRIIWWRSERLHWRVSLGCGWLCFSQLRATPTSRRFSSPRVPGTSFPAVPRDKNRFSPTARFKLCEQKVVVLQHYLSIGCFAVSSTKYLQHHRADGLSQSVYRYGNVDGGVQRTVARRGACKPRQSSQPSCLSPMLLVQSKSYSHDTTMRGD
jgi:hypothetical protein